MKCKNKKMKLNKILKFRKKKMKIYKQNKSFKMDP